MGIRPRRSGEVISIPVSGARDQFNELVTDVESKGKPAAEAIGDIAATAGSANSGTVEVAGVLASLGARVDSLEGRVAALESASTTSGTGWQAHKRGKMVTLAIEGIQSGFTLPAGYRPAIPIFAVLTSESGQNVTRMNIPTNGAVTLYGSPPNLVYGHAAFITT